MAPGRPDGRLRATGYVRVIERRDGPVAYAKLKLPDGSQPQRRLGKLWTKRTRPPPGISRGHKPRRGWTRSSAAKTPP